MGNLNWICLNFEVGDDFFKIRMGNCSKVSRKVLDLHILLCLVNWKYFQKVHSRQLKGQILWLVIYRGGQTDLLNVPCCPFTLWICFMDLVSRSLQGTDIYLRIQLQDQELYKMQKWERKEQWIERKLRYSNDAIYCA